MQRSVGRWAWLLIGLLACSSKADRERRAREQRQAELAREPPMLDVERPGSTDTHYQDPEKEIEASKVIYLVSTDEHLWSFDPRLSGASAYHMIGRLKCPSHGGQPQSMGIDRNGIAWVFYGSRELFKVDTRDASCTATTYVHPSYEGQLGMSFTSDAPGSKTEKLYIMSPNFGLATVGMPSLGVDKVGRMTTMAELTGGGDAKLFLFESTGQKLSEVDRTDFSVHLIHKFDTIGHFEAWAFARFAGHFYLFTAASAYAASKCTEYDPIRNIETVRDPNLGFVVVGAGQSTLVPPSDKGGEVSEPWPPKTLGPSSLGSGAGAL